MIFECTAEGFFLSIEGESHRLSLALNSSQRAYVIKTCPRKGGKVENGSIPKQQFDREIGWRFVPVTDESILARLMLLGME
jgi:hypothetical protein